MTLLTRTLRRGWVMPISHKEWTRMTTHRLLQGMVLSATFWRSQLCHQRLRAAASHTLLRVVHLLGLRVTPEALIHQHPMVSEMGSLVFVLVSTWWQQSPEQRGAGRSVSGFLCIIDGEWKGTSAHSKKQALKKNIQYILDCECNDDKIGSDKQWSSPACFPNWAAQIQCLLQEVKPPPLKLCTGQDLL